MDRLEYEVLEEINVIVEKDGDEVSIMKSALDKINEIVNWINSQ